MDFLCSCGKLFQSSIRRYLIWQTLHIYWWKIEIGNIQYVFMSKVCNMWGVLSGLFFIKNVLGMWVIFIIFYFWVNIMIARDGKYNIFCISDLNKFFRLFDKNCDSRKIFQYFNPSPKSWNITKYIRNPPRI